VSSEGDSGGEWAISESKDWKDGRHRRTNSFVLDHAGEVNRQSTRRFLTALENAYQRAARLGWIDSDWPEDVKDTDLYRSIRRNQDTEAFDNRVSEGDYAQLRAHTGSQRDEVDVSGWRDIERIREVVTERHLRLYIYGEPGNGKTRAGCLVARHWLEEMQENTASSDLDPVILTNIRSLAAQQDSCIWVSNWPELQEMMSTEMDDILNETTRPFLFLFDEASSQAAGRGKKGHEASTKLATLVYKIRKYGGAIVSIGHDGKDLHPAVRELCIALEKTDKKVARFYRSVKNRSGVDPITPEITGWPDSMWTPNDKDPAPWSWSDPETGESAENDGHIQSEEEFKELAIWSLVRYRERNQDDAVGWDKYASEYLNGAYSGEWCRRRWNEYRDGSLADTVARVDEVIA